MTKPVQRGSVAIAIKLPFQREFGQLQIAQAEPAISKLLDRLDRQQILLTWAIAEPIAFSLTDRIAARGHEIALLMPPPQSVVGTRTEFVRSVAKPLAAAKLRGRTISTIVAEDSYCLEHIDLLVKYGVSVVCMASKEFAAGLQKICFGLAAVNVNAVITGHGRVSTRSQMKLLDRALNRATATSELCTVQLDLSCLLTDDSRQGLQTIDLALASFAQLRDDGRIEIGTVAALARKMSSQAKIEPARSILRAA